MQAQLIDLLLTGRLRAMQSVTADDELQSNFGVLLLYDLISRYPSVRAVAGDPNVLLEPGARGSVALRTDAAGVYVKTADTPNTTWVQLATVAGATVHTSAPITGDGSLATPVTVQNNPTLPGNVGVTGNLTASAGVVTGGQLVALGLLAAQVAVIGDTAPTDGLIDLLLGGAAGPTIRAVSGDPNGTLAVDGSIALDSNGRLWLKTGGAGVWTQPGAGGSALFDTVIPVTITGTGIGIFTVNDWNPGALGQTTLLKVTRDNLGFGINVTGMVAGAEGQVVCAVDMGGTAAQVQYMNQNAGSAAANRFQNQQNTDISATRGAFWWRYDGTAARWIQIAATAL